MNIRFAARVAMPIRTRFGDEDTKKQTTTKPKIDPAKVQAAVTAAVAAGTHYLDTDGNAVKI